MSVRPLLVRALSDLKVWALVCALGLLAAPSHDAQPALKERPAVADKRSVRADRAKHQRRMAKKKNRRSDDSRDGILDRIRLDCDDPATCFFGEEDGPVAVEPESLTEEELDGLLQEILAGLQAHQDQAVAAGRAEMSDLRLQEEQYFGAADHHRAPSTPYYQSPLEVLQDRPALHLDKVDPRDFDIPILLNDRTQRWMVYFLTLGGSRSQVAGSRSDMSPSSVKSSRRRGPKTSSTSR